MYIMITDSLTCRPQEKPCRSGAPLPLLVPYFLARTRPLLCPAGPRGAARASRPRRARYGRLYRRRPQGETSQRLRILHGLARRTAPQPQPPRNRSRASRLPAQESPAGTEKFSGARGEAWFSGLAHYRTTYKVGPFRSVTQADSGQERPQREAGASRIAFMAYLALRYGLAPSIV